MESDAFKRHCLRSFKMYSSSVVWQEAWLAIRVERSKHLKG